MFKWPYHYLPLLVRNLGLEEHPNSVDLGLSADTSLLKSDSVRLFEHFSLYHEGKTGHLGS